MLINIQIDEKGITNYFQLQEKSAAQHFKTHVLSHFCHISKEADLPSVAFISGLWYNIHQMITKYRKNLFNVPEKIYIASSNSTDVKCLSEYKTFPLQWRTRISQRRGRQPQRGCQHTI